VRASGYILSSTGPEGILKFLGQVQTRAGIKLHIDVSLTGSRFQVQLTPKAIKNFRSGVITIR
jgi:hypothetical protein